MISGIIVGLLFAITAFFIIGIIGYLSKIETRLEKLERYEKCRSNNE